MKTRLKLFLAAVRNKSDPLLSTCDKNIFIHNRQTFFGLLQGASSLNVEIYNQTKVENHAFAI